MESDAQGSSTLVVISALDAFKLLQIKHILPHRTLVSVHGKVSAVSEIVRINKDSVLLIELESSSVIVVKQPQFHKWHEQLVVNHSFIFTNLRPTTLSKSYSPQQRVYVPWTGSRLLTDDVDVLQYFCVTLQKWLRSFSLSSPLEDEQGHEGDYKDDDTDVSGSSTFYQGVVTDISELRFQIFELDKNVRLYLCFLPKLQNPVQLRVGDVVTVHNAHCSIDSLTHKKHLFCCMRSSIHVANDNKQSGATESGTSSETTSTFTSPALSLLSQFVFTQSDVQPLFHLYSNVCQVLGKESVWMNSEAKGGLKRVLQGLLNSVLYAPNGRRPRNYILEFCQHQAFCPLSQMQIEMTGEIPRLSPLVELMQGTRSNPTDTQDDGTSTTGAGDEQVWRYHSDSFSEGDRRHLLGWFAVSSSTGHLQLMDSQTAVDAVINIQLSGTLLHQCSSALCDCSTVSPGEQFKCPFVQPCCLGHLVLVKKYTVVTETFCSEGDNGGDLNPQSLKMVYLVVSAQDCLLVQKKDPESRAKPAKKRRSSSAGLNQSNISCRKRAAGKKDLEQSPGPSDKIVYITSKHHLCAREAGKKKQSYVQFYAEGFVVMPKNGKSESRRPSLTDGNGEAAREIGSQKKAKMDRRKSGEVTCSSGKTTPSFNSRRQRKLFSAHSSSSQSDFHFDSDSFQLRQPLSLMFEDENCRWFDVIHPPGLYRFSSREGTPPLVWPQIDQKLQQAMDRAGTRCTVNVSSEAVIEKMCSGCEDKGVDVTISRLQLQSALSDRPSQLVNFRGVVIWRRHPASQLSDFRPADSLLRRRRQKMIHSRTLSSLLGQRSLCVGVRDTVDPSVTASVYFSLSTLTYPQGLLPGAVIDFHRLDRKMSKAGKTYFSFLPVSGLRVVCGKQDCSSQTMQTSAVNQAAQWEDTPTQLLIDMWQSPCPKDLFVTGCHLCQFFRVSLKSVCMKCGSLFQPSGCSAAACSNTEHSQLLARISVLVEDGSGQVLVHVNRRCPPDVARKLLLLPQTQWHHLETAVQQHGELFLQQFGHRGGTAVEDFVSLLCDSRRVKRPCWLMLRKPEPYDKKPAKQLRDAASALETFTADNEVDMLIMGSSVQTCDKDRQQSVPGRRLKRTGKEPGLFTRC